MAKERPPLEEMTLRQLRRVASEYNVSRYSRMRKAQLLSEIQNIEKQRLSQSPSTVQEENIVEASKFDLGIKDKVATDLAPVNLTPVNLTPVNLTPVDLASVDEGLGDLPAGYGESRIVLMPRDPQWCYAYWDVTNEHKEELRRQGGQQLSLRLCDVTDVNLESQAPHSVQEYLCDELAREWYLPIPVSDRDYVLDIGYRCADGRWLVLARSARVHVPPVYPSDWIEDVFVSLSWEEELVGKSVYELVSPSKKVAPSAPVGANYPIYDEIFYMAQGVEAQRVAGSLFGSMQHVPGSMVPQESISSYIFPSGVGMWAGAATAPAAPAVPTLSGVGWASGIGLMSGVGFSAEAIPLRPRKFWLIADAELIVYGATEPDATVTVGGQPIKLNPDGTFRFQMSFQDGLINYPIMAVASDGEQTRSIHMKFNRETPSRHTNTKEEAVLEWLF